jgi:hypothetical protein
MTFLVMSTYPQDPKPDQLHGDQVWPFLIRRDDDRKPLSEGRRDEAETGVVTRPILPTPDYLMAIVDFFTTHEVISSFYDIASMDNGVDSAPKNN